MYTENFPIDKFSKRKIVFESDSNAEKKDKIFHLFERYLWIWKTLQTISQIPTSPFESFHV